MFDALGFIKNYIRDKIRELLDDPINEYQDPNWVQAAELFTRVVIPCEEFNEETIHSLAKDIVKEASQHNNQVVYQDIPGMYNQKIVDFSTSNGKDIEIIQYDYLINKIKKWMEIQK
jgi:hypothetical protein